MKHDRPVHGVELEDVLADQMNVCGPNGQAGTGGRWAAEGRECCGVAQGGWDGKIVHQRIEPDVSHIAGIEGQGDSPGESGGRTGDAEVFELLGTQETQDLVAPVGGLDELGILFKVLDQPRLVLTQLEVPVLLNQFLHNAPLRIPGTVGIAVFFGEERFLLHRIKSPVGRLVEVTRRVESVEQRHHDLLMTGIGGANEIVVTQPEELDEGTPLDGEVVAIGLRRLA